MQLSLKIEGIQETNGELKKIDAKVRGGLIREVAKTTTNIHREAYSNAPMGAEGFLKKGIRFIVTDLAGEVFSSAKYSVGVEKGQKPGTWPHVGDLTRWVSRKLGVPKNRLKSVTYLIGKKIFEKGTDAQPFFEPAVKKHEKRFFRNVQRLINKL